MTDSPAHVELIFFFLIRTSLSRYAHVETQKTSKLCGCPLRQVVWLVDGLQKLLNWWVKQCTPITLLKLQLIVSHVDV